MRKLPAKSLSDSWLKAAVVGSLWASVEIIAGSFLHNLRIPFSGTILTSFSVFLLIAFFQLWNETGIIWRAGLVCALMKSLSPSAVIIGPMVGILSEAIIIWIFILLFGKNLFSYILGGAVAVVSALFHKVASLIILYGFDLVKLLEGLYQYAVRQLRVESLDPLWLISLIVIAYMLLGGIAATLGYISGKRQRTLLYSSPDTGSSEFKSQSELFKHTSKKQYSLLLLIGHLLLIVMCLWSVNAGNYFVSVPLCSLYLAVCFIWYKDSMSFLKKKGIWIQFVLITLIASFLLEGQSSGDYFSVQGLMTGLKMIIRAFVIMIGFTAISVELKNPLVRAVLYNRGFANIYQSLSLAFSAFPGIVATMPKTREFLKDRKLLLSHLFSTSVILLERFRADALRRPTLMIITGDVGQGKTTFISRFLERIRQDGSRAGGILAPGIFQGNRKEGFWLEDIISGKRYHLSSTYKKDGWLKFGHYYFDPEVLEKGNEIISSAAEKEVNMIVVDEVGPLELNNLGWAPAIERLCKKTTLPQLWVVRRSLAIKAARKWNFGDVYIFDMNKDNEEEMISTIQRIIS